MSHNNICEDGATYMGKAIAANDTLEELDLSWNSIRRKGAVTICKALKVLIGCCLHTITLWLGQCSPDAQFVVRITTGGCIFNWCQ